MDDPIQKASWAGRNVALDTFMRREPGLGGMSLTVFFPSPEYKGFLFPHGNIVDDWEANRGCGEGGLDEWKEELSWVEGRYSAEAGDEAKCAHLARHLRLALGIAQRLEEHYHAEAEAHEPGTLLMSAFYRVPSLAGEDNHLEDKR